MAADAKSGGSMQMVCDHDRGQKGIRLVRRGRVSPGSNNNGNTFVLSMP